MCVERKDYCDVCGEKFVGPEEMICENGHNFCECHEEFFFPTDEQKKEYLARHNVKLTAIQESDALSEIYANCLNKYGENFNSCPVCKFDALDRKTIIVYLLKRLGITERDLLKELKEKFGNDFKAYLRSIE